MWDWVGFGFDIWEGVGGMGVGFVLCERSMIRSRISSRVMVVTTRDSLVSFEFVFCWIN